MRFRYTVAVGCGDLGRRVTIRFRLPGSGLSDVVGVLETCDDRTFGVRDRSGATRVIERADVVSARVVPPPEPGPRPER